MTPDEKMEARRWAEERMEYARTPGYNLRRRGADMAAKFILDNIQPETLADMDERDIIPGMGVTDHTGESLVFQSMAGAGRSIALAMHPDTLQQHVRQLADLTPNGKHYMLVQTGHQVTSDVLSTVEEYEGAPTGTVVMDLGSIPFIKLRDVSGHVMWHSISGNENSADMARIPREVLRWGWGDELDSNEQ